MTKKVEPGSACVVVIEPETGRVLAEMGPRGDRPPGLPGGKREPYDADSLRTARRELLEETGVELRAGSSILTYEVRDPRRPDRHTVCEAFLAVAVDRYPTDDELAARGCTWVDAVTLVSPGSRFPEYCARIFATMATTRNKSKVIRLESRRGTTNRGAVESGKLVACEPALPRCHGMAEYRDAASCTCSMWTRTQLDVARRLRATTGSFEEMRDATWKRWKQPDPDALRTSRRTTTPCWPRS